MAKLNIENNTFTYTNTKGKDKTVKIPNVFTVDGEKQVFAELKTKKAKQAFVDAVEASYLANAQKQQVDYDNLPEDKKAELAEKSRQASLDNWDAKTDEDKAKHKDAAKAAGQNAKAIYDALSDDEKEARKAAQSTAEKEKYNNLSDEEKAERKAKALAGQKSA